MPRPRRRRVIAGDELRPRLDVDELGARRPAPSAGSARRSSSEPANPPPSHAARQVTITGRRRPSRAPSASGPVDAVEAQLDQVGVRRGVARAAQLLHRPSRDGDAQLRISSGHKSKKPPQPGLRRLLKSLSCGVQASGPPPQRARTTTNRTQSPGRTRDDWPRKRQRQNECDNNRPAGSLSISPFAPASRAAFLLDRQAVRLSN